MEAQAQRWSGPANGHEVTGMIGPALPPAWRRYRDGFVLLQHIRTLEEEDERRTVSAGRLASDLGISREYLDDITNFLVKQRYVSVAGAHGELRLSLSGRAYLERYANRRRSVRPAAQEEAAPATRAVNRPAALELTHREWPRLTDLFSGLRRLVPRLITPAFPAPLSTP